MTPITLIYRRDDQTQLPRLESPSRSVPEDVLRKWDEELRKDFNDLQIGRKSQVEFRYSAFGFPRVFDVKLLGEGDSRMRTIQLTESGEPRAETTACEGVAPAVRTDDWRMEFLMELEAFAGTLESQRPFGLGLRVVLNELRNLATEHPQKFTLVLLAGYLHVTERMCEQSGDVQRMCYYVATSQLLAQACETMEPEDLLPVPNLGRPVRGSTGVTQSSQGLYHMLCKLLHLTD